MDDYDTFDYEEEEYTSYRYLPPPSRPVYDTLDVVHQSNHNPRLVIEILLKTAVIHAVVIASYIYLRRVQKVPQTDRLARIGRLVLFAFMPTLVWAEVIINLVQTVLPLFLRPDVSNLNIATSDEANIRAHLKAWTQHIPRHLCSIAGMYVTSPPGEDTEQTQSLLDQNDEAAAGEDTPDRGEGAIAEELNKTQGVVKLRLAEVYRSSDVRQHTQSWSLGVTLRILVLVLPLLQGIGIIVLYARRSSDILSLDKRNFVAGIASIVCSLCAITILLLRLVWSLQPASSTAQRYPLRTLVAEILLAAVLNEAPWSSFGVDILPISWVNSFLQIGVIGIVLTLCIIGLILAFVILFSDRIEQKMKINWQVVLGIPIVVMLVWTLADLVSYLVADIITLTEPWSWRSYDWDRDPWSIYLPFC